METTHKVLIDWLEQQLSRSENVSEVLRQDPKLDVLAAYRVQQALIQRRVAAGDRVIGYKAALTSKAMQVREGIAEPVLGTLLGSRLRDESAPFSLHGFMKGTAEPEVGVIMARDLAGPGVTPQAALAAIAGFTAAVEVGDIRTEGKRSLQHTICCNTFNGGHVFGALMAAPAGIDLRREGMAMARNGDHQASATAAEVLGNPMHSVVFMANKLAELGLALKAGMVLLTGSIVSSIPVVPGDQLQVVFSRLGELNLRFTK